MSNTFLPMTNTAAAHLVRRIFIADFILFAMSFLAYIVQLSRQRKVLMVSTTSEVRYNDPTLVRIRNWRYGSAILNHGAAAVLSMVVVTIFSATFRPVAEILIWIMTGLVVVWALASTFKRHHLVDMAFALVCLGIYAALFGIVFNRTH